VPVFFVSICGSFLSVYIKSTSTFVDPTHSQSQISLGRSDRASVVRASDDDEPSARQTSTVNTSEEPSDDFDMNPNIFIRKTNFPIASGGLGDVYKCTLNRSARLEEVLHTTIFSVPVLTLSSGGSQISTVSESK